MNHTDLPDIFIGGSQRSNLLWGGGLGVGAGRDFSRAWRGGEQRAGVGARQSTAADGAGGERRPGERELGVERNETAELREREGEW